MACAVGVFGQSKNLSCWRWPCMRKFCVYNQTSSEVQNQETTSMYEQIVGFSKKTKLHTPWSPWNLDIMAVFLGEQTHHPSAGYLPGEYSVCSEKSRSAMYRPQSGFWCLSLATRARNMEDFTRAFNSKSSVFDHLKTTEYFFATERLNP